MLEGRAAAAGSVHGSYSLWASFECPRFTGESWQAYGVEVVNCIGRKLRQSVDEGALDMRGHRAGAVATG